MTNMGKNGIFSIFFILRNNQFVTLGTTKYLHATNCLELVIKYLCCIYILT